MKLVLPLLAALFLTGCSKGPETVLPGSANAIPLFQPSRLQDFVPSKVEWVGNTKRETNAWVWKTQSPVADVIGFYKTSLPAAKVSKSANGTLFTWSDFPGAQSNETVTVNVEESGVFRISECLAPHKHKRQDEIVKAFPADNDLPAH